MRSFNYYRSERMSNEVELLPVEQIQTLFFQPASPPAFSPINWIQDTEFEKEWLESNSESVSCLAYTNPKESPRCVRTIVLTVNNTGSCSIFIYIGAFIQHPMPENWKHKQKKQHEEFIDSLESVGIQPEQTVDKTVEFPSLDNLDHNRLIITAASAVISEELKRVIPIIIDFEGSFAADTIEKIEGFFPSGVFANSLSM